MVEEVILSNGLKVLLKEEKGFEILSGTLFMPGGSSVDPVEGITLLTLRTAFKRSLKRPAGEFYSLQEQMGTPFSPEVSVDYSQLRFQSVSRLSADYTSLLTETVLSPGFIEESFEIEKASLLASIRAKRESSFTLAYETMMRLTYGGAPYSKMPYGREESVSSLTLDRCSGWFESAFIPEGSVVSLCGDLRGVDSILKELEEISLKPLETERFECPIAEFKTEFVHRKGSAQSFILIALNAPPVQDSSYPVYKLLNTVLGEGIGSVLFQELREKRGFAYSTGSLYPSRVNSGRLLIYIGTSPEKENLVREELRRIVSNLPAFLTEDLVERGKRYFRGTYLLDHETRGKKAWYFGFWEVLGRGYSYDTLFLQEIEKVRLRDILDIAEKVSCEPFHEVVVKDETDNS